MLERNICNDCVSSVLVPYGYGVTLYDGAAFNGEKIALQGGFFEDANLKAHCYNIDSYFDNRISSLEVWRTG